MKKYLFLDRGLMNPRQMSNAKLNLEKIRKDKTVFSKKTIFRSRPENGRSDMTMDILM